MLFKPRHSFEKPSTRLAKDFACYAAHELPGAFACVYIRAYGVHVLWLARYVCNS
jgi:hypothetical protein